MNTTTPDLFKNAARIAYREARHGMSKLTIFLISLVLGISMITSVGLISNAIDHAMEREAQSLLGGDIEVLSTNNPLPDDVIAFMSQYGTLSLSQEMRSMGRTDKNASLIEIKAVDSFYPLAGSIELEPAISLEEALKNNGAVAEEASLLRLGIEVGDTISIGKTTATIRAKLQKEPDRIINTFSFAPRIMIDDQTLKASGLVQPTSLMHYRYRLLLSPEHSVAHFEEAMDKPFPQPDWRRRNLTESSQSISNALDRFNLFLTLTSLTTLLIGGIGISSAVSRFLEAKATHIAILKTIGGSKRLIFTAYLLLLLSVTVIGIIISILLGSLLAYIAIPFITVFIPAGVSFVFTATPILLAFIYGILTVLTFSLYAIGRAIEIKPALLFRGGLAVPQKVRTIIIAANYTAAALLIIATVIMSNDAGTALLFIQIAIAAVFAFMVTGNAVTMAAKYIHPKRPWLRLAVANIHRPGAPTVSIILSIGIGLTVLVTLLLVQGNLQKRITESIPEKAPSLFFLDIQPWQYDAFTAFLKNTDSISDILLTPMTRGHISHIKDVPVEEAKVEPKSRWAVRGDRGLTYAATPPANATIIEGEWWPADYDGEALLSFDSRVADGMHVGIGDTLSLQVGGTAVTARIANLRQIDYSSLQVNFAMVLSPNTLKHLPHSFVGTVRVQSPAEEARIIQTIATQFPNVSTVQISGVLALLNEVIGYVSLALKVMISFTLLAGILVLSAALTAARDKRAYDTVMLKVLGAKRRDIIKTYMAEWVILALITSLVSIGLGELFAWELLKRFRGQEFFLLPGVIFSNVTLSILIITVIGFIGNLKAFNARPAALLRNE